MVHAKLGIVSSLFSALHAKHVPTASHSLRVACCVSTWGIHERLRERELEQVEIAGLLHDIGKIGVPDSILQKPDRLSADEQATIGLHPQIGIEILRSAGASSNLLESVRNVGVWFNQLSSSQGKFDEIAAQMISIADAFDSMTSDQVYRKALSQEQALKELFKNSGTQFNPKLVRSFANSLTQRSPQVDSIFQQRWLGSLHSTNINAPSQFTAISMLNLNAAQQSLTSIFRNQLLDTMQDAVIFVDLDCQILEWNCTAERLSGVTKNSILQHQWNCELLGMRTSDGIRIDERTCPIKSVLRSRTPLNQRIEILHRDGRAIMVESDTVPVLDQTRSMCGVALFFRDASEQVSLEQHVLTLHERATKDPLTKAANRAELNRRLPEFVTMHQDQHLDGSLIICDIDFFKRINDTYGHPAGDEALVVFASILRELTRDTDLVARYGGEEFVILCPSCNMEMAVEKAERIRQELGNRPLPSLRSSCISASFGVSAILPQDTHESLLNRADRALLMAKEGGRNRVIKLSGTDAPAVELDTNKAGGGGWLRWLGLAPGEVLLECKFMSLVPMDLTIEKIRGFVADHHAEIGSAEKFTIAMKVDSRYINASLRDGDRPALFYIELAISEIDYQHGDSKQIRTLLGLRIRAGKQRDRRTQNLVHQAEKMRSVIQSYLGAQPYEAKDRERIKVIQGAEAAG